MLDANIPRIDPSVKHIGVSKLRGLNASKLKDNAETFVIQENDKPLAVLLSYEKFLIIQEQLESFINVIELLYDQEEVKGVRNGLDDVRAGRTRSLADIRAELKGRG